MSEWQTITFRFDIFDPLRPPLEAALTALEVIEAILEALLDLIRPFMLDLLNPLRAIIAALLAALRALINQIRSTGVAVLLVHPDFSQPDFSGVLYSVSGAYPGFESKVVNKFYDTSDIFRPQYPPGSSVAMLVFYIGADSPGDLLGLLFALLALIKHPIQLSGLPAPVGLKVLPVKQGGDAISQFRNLFDSDLDQALSLEWRMPQSPSGMGAAGFAGQIVSFYNTFRFPNFIIERHGPFPQDDGDEQLDQRGEVLRIKTNSNNLGNVVDSTIAKYSFPRVNSLIPVREEDGTVHRIFNSKRAIQFGGSGEAQDGEPIGSPTSALAADTALITGIATGTYRYLDEDEKLIPGRTYYYRVRAFFGDATDYLNLTKPDAVLASQVGLVQAGNFQVLRTSPKLTLGKPSRVVKGFVPRKVDVNAQAFNAYQNIYDAIRAGLLLNLDLPPAGPGDTSFRQEQKTGWGTLGMLGGQIALAKASVASFNSESTRQLIQTRLDFAGGASLILAQSDQLLEDAIFNATARRLANSVIDKLFDNSAFVNLLADQWNEGVGETVQGILTETQAWFVLGIIGGVTPEANAQIETYLSLEEQLVNPDGTFAAGEIMVSPLPIQGDSPPAVLVQERLDLANFLRTALSTVSSRVGYLSWYSVTVGDLFPFLTPFLFDFEDFLAALLKALESALKEIADIIETLLQKIRALKQMLETILALLDLLQINISVSVLSMSTTNGSAETLVQALISSENKPGDSPFGLHSGMVLTAGGPGQGFIAALEAIKFILTIPL